MCSVIECAVPRIVIAGTGSGCGKTTVASGLISALCARGLVVQAFKVGPDYIDPSHHRMSSKRSVRNLDPFMMGESGVIDTFVRASEGADIAVIEGVMGLFDGADGGDFSSTAHVSRILNAPVVLVVQARGMSRSVHAMVQGFSSFDPAVRVEGFICTMGGSERHEQMIRFGAQKVCYGWIPRREDLAVDSRHLGLVMATEDDRMQRYGTVIEECCDVDGLIACAQQIKPVYAQPLSRCDQKRVTIGVALDAAFCFYYDDNFDILRSSGAELVFFSPMTDSLPEADAYYFGGGYPELHLDALTNAPCIDALHRSVDDGKIVLGECGGLMWLSESITIDGRTVPVANLLAGSCEMEKKFVGLGYVKGEVTGGTVFPHGKEILGHEYHYSRMNFDPGFDARFAYTLSRGKGICDGKDGLYVDSVMGYYTHLYLTPVLAQSLVAAIEQSKK
ncbi:MAG: cobyrinate a,c-diamide synthase [Euryarchaeota archaeon]|nr:cobyrinate a,c-diamide synthase [Euryarchaeota archaeon]